MVKFNKSIWPVRRSLSVGGTLVGLFLLPILVFIGINMNPIAASKAENVTTALLPTVATSDIQVIPPQAMVQPQKESPAEAKLSATNDSIADSIASFATSSGWALKIDAINLNIPLSKTTLDANHALLVPKNPNVAAWYQSGPKPGNAGSALITGHLDSAAGAAVFYNLRQLKTDDLIQVRRDDGKVATFQVQKTESYPQNSAFPWSDVYTTSGPSTLHLITCDGVYSPKTGRYSRNLVVFASLISLD